MDNKITEQLRAEAKDALVHWAKTDKLGRRIAAQRIVIDAIHLLNKYELYKVDNEMAEIISETKKGSNLRR